VLVRGHPYIAPDCSGFLTGICAATGCTTYRTGGIGTDESIRDHTARAIRLGQLSVSAPCAQVIELPTPPVRKPRPGGKGQFVAKIALKLRLRSCWVYMSMPARVHYSICQRLELAAPNPSRSSARPAHSLSRNFEPIPRLSGIFCSSVGPCVLGGLGGTDCMDILLQLCKKMGRVSNPW